MSIEATEQQREAEIPSSITTERSGPHDNSFIAAGLARYGFRKEASDIIAGIFEASWFFNHRLPEVFAGYERVKTRYPVQYTTACIPQRTLLGLEPKGEVLTSAANPIVPFWMGTLTVDGIPGRWGRTRVVAKGDDTAVLNMKQTYERLLRAREELGKKELAA